MSFYKAYTILMSLELSSIGIMYQGSDTNPFQQSSPICFLFLTSVFCHVVATMADMSLPTTMIIFHFSGLVGCETLLWILLPEFWNWYIINLFLLMVTSLCFFNCIHDIAKLFLPTHLTTATEPPNSEQHEASQA
ncbi:transmembrane protein, putative [Medicago truncatula]|uniref:Transmembrane protein, putative n=1 Tax=Medicago truncatula TaxID=3880 RepID=G7J283_MEDTR|nr:transmembrane protein, putative [Medicago truncatula]